jgi:RNA polymerase sigma-70 factor, ECF subfamily
MTDEQLLSRAGRGDEAAFMSLYDRHRLPVFRFAYRMLNSAALAEEVTHDCFLGLIRDPGRFDPRRAALRTYLFAAARNLSAKHFRHYAGGGSYDEAAAAPRGPEDGGPLTRILREEAAEAVRAAVAALPPAQREVVVLFEYEGLTLAEVAAVVCADAGAVKSRLHRARRRLRCALAPYFENDGAAPAERVCK